MPKPETGNSFPLDSPAIFGSWKCTITSRAVGDRALALASEFGTNLLLDRWVWFVDIFFAPVRGSGGLGGFELVGASDSRAAEQSPGIPPKHVDRSCHIFAAATNSSDGPSPYPQLLDIDMQSTHDVLTFKNTQTRGRRRHTS